MNYNLFDAQKAAITKGHHRDGFAYYMEQGLGKTLTTLHDFKIMIDESRATRMVVVSPNSFKSGWKEEIESKGFDFNTHVFNSGATTDNNNFLSKGFNSPAVVIVNYEALRSESTQKYITEFCRSRKVLGVLDESIQIKTHNSAQTKAVLGLAPNFSTHRVLSGKPSTEGPHDLWAQMRYIRQLEGRNYYAFKTFFCKMGGFKAKQVIGAQNEDVLRELLEPHIFRATKKDWTDLPEKVYTLREYTMSPELKRMYDQMENDFILALESKVITVDAAITKYIKLAQIQCGFVIDENGGLTELVESNKNPRIHAVSDILKYEVVGKSSVVYHHTHSYNLLAQALAAYRPACIRGGMTSDEVEKEKKRFNEDPNCRLILLQDGASKYGHTLLGGVEKENHCSTQIFFESTYSLDTRSQVEDRSHRYGQLGECMSYYDLCCTPLDRNVVKALQRKENMFQSVFSKLAT